MISVVVSKWVADAFGKEGIYSVWIAMRQYPWLPPDEYRDQGQTAAQIVKPVESLVIIHDDEMSTLKDLNTFFETRGYHGYPVIRDDKLLGYTVAEKTKAFIGTSWEPTFSCFSSISYHRASARTRCIYRRPASLYVLETSRGQQPRNSRSVWPPRWHGPTVTKRGPAPVRSEHVPENGWLSSFNRVAIED